MFRINWRDLARDLFWCLVALAVLALVFGVPTSAFEIDAANTETGETYIKYCWIDGTPPYTVTIDNGEPITLWAYDCIVSSELQPATLHSIVVKDSTEATLYYEATTEENIFTSRLAWWIYFDVAMLLISLVFPFFVFISWVAGLVALTEVLNTGQPWTMVFIVGFLFVAGFMRLVMARRGS